MLSNLLNVREYLGTSNYLGLPSLIGRNKKNTFNYIMDCMWRKINSWSGRALSRAGREVIVRSILQSIPSYCMSIFLLPHSLSLEIERMMNSFLWGSNRRDAKGINWMWWEKMAIRKEFGGMGFRSLDAFNLAMIEKQGWRLISYPEAMISIIFKAKNFLRNSFLDSNLGHNSSFAWRSI